MSQPLRLVATDPEGLKQDERGPRRLTLTLRFAASLCRMRAFGAIRLEFVSLCYPPHYTESPHDLPSRRNRGRHWQDAAHPPRRRLGGDRLRDPRQGRVHEPRRVGQGPRRAVHHRATPKRAARCGPAASSSRAPPATPASASRMVADALGYRTVIVIPETQTQEKKDMLRLAGAELIEVPAVPYANPEQLRALLRAPRRGAGADGARRRDLGQPVRQRRQPARALRDDRAGDLGRRPAARSTASSARSAPAARWPASAWRSRSATAPSRSPSPIRWARRSTPTTRRRAEGSRAPRSPRASARAASPPISKARRSISPTRSRTRRRCRSSSTSWSRGPAARRLDRHQCRRRDPAGPRPRPRPHHRHDPCATPARATSKLFNPAFLREKGLPVPAWLETKGRAPEVFVK